MLFRKRLSFILASCAMILLILDTKTAIGGAKDGIDMCMRSLIPSIFPFIIVSSYLTQNLIGRHLAVMRPINKLCRIPKGFESLFLIGIIGGYPTGAQSVYHAYQTGTLKRTDAQRMIIICNNAGPSFIFGIIGRFFSSSITVWALWGIHILSAVIIGMILPGNKNEWKILGQGQKKSFITIVQNGAKTMLNICSWVILFRILIAYTNKLFVQNMNSAQITLVHGFLELANGCLSLGKIPNEPVRFVLCSAMLSFGGLCVFLQTSSVTNCFSNKLYFLGKVMQCCISTILAVILQQFIYKTVKITPLIIPLLLICVIICNCQSKKV